MLPKFIELSSNDDTIDVAELTSTDSSNLGNVLLDISFSLFSDGGDFYWEMSHNGESAKMFLINDYITTSFLGISLSGLSIITIYVSFVYVVGTTIRSVFYGASTVTPYEEMPFPDRLIELGVMIRLAQYNRQLLLEKNLYEVLIRLYRSPEMLLGLTGDYLRKPMLQNKEKN